MSVGRLLWRCRHCGSFRRTEGGDGMSTAEMIELTIDGRAVSVPSGTTVFDAARLNGIPIPTLCHQQNETPVGVCRVCLVEAGGRVLTASCVRPAENNMVVSTHSPKVVNARKTVVELL